MGAIKFIVQRGGADVEVWLAGVVQRCWMGEAQEGSIFFAMFHVIDS